MLILFTRLEYSNLTEYKPVCLLITSLALGAFVFDILHLIMPSH